MNENFKDFVATVIVDNDKFFIVDWRHKDGGSNYFVRYICDLKLGSLIINGDLGSCVANWYHSVSVAEFRQYMNDLSYFIEKFKCYTDRCYRSKEVIDSDLADLKKRIIEDEWVDDLSEIDEDFKEIRDYFVMHWKEDAFLEPDIIEIFKKYSDEWWEDEFADIGLTVHPFVKLWVEGFNLALEQLERAGEQSHEYSN